MVFLKRQAFWQESAEEALDILVACDVITPYSSIYRCEACGHEILSTKGAPMPSAAHHQHSYNQEAIRWRLIVRTIKTKRTRPTLT